MDLTINFFKYGWLGVPLFFMISGFVISYTSYFKKKNAKEFLYKRFARIYPLYFVILVVFLILLIVFPEGTFGETFYQIDIRTVWDSLFFGFGEAKGYIGISWTLFYEICFYLFFSLIVFEFKKISRSRNFYIVICLIQFLLFILSNPLFLSLNYVSKLTIYNASYFVIGITLFLITINPGGLKYKEPLSIFLFFSLGLILLDNVYALLCFIVIFTFLIIEKINFNLFSNNYILKLSNSTYSIYITQLLPISISNKLFNFILLNFNTESRNPIYLTSLSFLTYIFCILFAIIVGILCNKYIEKPIYRFLISVQT